MKNRLLRKINEKTLPSAGHFYILHFLFWTLRDGVRTDYIGSWDFHLVS